MQLPLLLAGPIVRRVTPDRVWVWLATSELLDNPELRLFARDGKPVTARAEWYPLSLGEHLWVYMLCALPEVPLLPGRAYEYEVKLKSGAALFQASDLAQIVLRGAQRPSFVLGSQDRPELRALYASCRKLHGPNPDMMEAAEQAIQDAAPAERPQYFFLGGDQIYADDVHPDFLALTQPLRDALFGTIRELIPGLNPFLVMSPRLKRAEHLKAFFTSGEMDHHLLTLAEYAAAYLMAWNGSFWKSLAELGGIPLDATLMGAVRGARSARRVLANTVCYMIFDDHEITDDWFLNQDWEDKVAQHPAAMRIVANGLAAYWAFQGWGNCPEVYDRDFRDTVSQFAQGRGRNTEQAWTLLRGADWSFLAPTSPPALFLDTRTRRQSSPREFKGPGYGRPLAPRLLGPKARTKLADLIDREVSPGKPLIVIAPAPVFGFPPMEWIQGQVGKVSPSTADLESWSANPRNIQDAFDLLSRSAPEPLVILSGDVHYGFEVVGRLMSTTVSVPFLQFCSSALKNKTIGGKKLFFDFLSSAGDVRQSFVYWDRSVSGRSDGALYFAEADSYSARVFFDQYGSPSAFIDSFFVQRPDRSGGKQRIEDKNNLGELVVSSATVSHRHWFFEILPQPESMEAPRSRGRFAPRALLSWDPGDWPVKSVLDRLLEALRL